MRRAVGMGMWLALGVLLCGLALAVPASGEVLLPDPSLSGFTNGVVEPDYEGVLRVWPGRGPGPFVQKFVFVTREDIRSRKLVFNIMERVLTARPSLGGVPTETLQDVPGAPPRAPRVKATVATPAGVVVTLKGVQICGLAHTPLLDGKPPSRVYFNDCLQTALRPICPVANVTSVVAEVPANGIPAGSTIEFLVGLPPIPTSETGPVIGCVVPGVDPDHPCDSSVTLCWPTGPDVP